MKALHACSLGFIAILLGLILAFPAPASAHRPALSGDRLTGELVVNRGSTTTFHIVGHEGNFTAPGFDLLAWDGKPVEVEFGRDGRVANIRPLNIQYQQITHGFDVVSGQLVLRDPLTGSFYLAGDNRAYTAPAGIDVGAYAGRMVEIRLDENGRVMNIYPITRAADAPLPRSYRDCTFGESFANGASICRDGSTVRCSDGSWIDLGAPCR